MSRAREAREARRAQEQQRVEATLWSSFSTEERRLWRLFSDAVADVRPMRAREHRGNAVATQRASGQ